MEDFRTQLMTDIKKIEWKVYNNEPDEYEVSVKEIEKQKIYFWIRVYLKEEDHKSQVGDTINIVYQNGEHLSTKFVAYGKKNLNRDLDSNIINYDPEDNTKVLCLMVDEDDIRTNNKNIPFIRTLFKTSPYYQEQVYRRNDLVFLNERTQEKYDYIEVDF